MSRLAGGSPFGWISRAQAFFAAVLLVVVFLAVVLVAAFLAGAFFAGVFFAGAFFAVVFEAVDVAAVDLAAVFAGALFAGAFFAVDFDAVDVFFVVVFFAGAFAAGAFLAGAVFVAVGLVVAGLAAVMPGTCGRLARVSFGSFLAPEMTFFRSAPGLNFGTAVFFALSRSPVCGLRTQRAGRTRFSNEPNPVMATFSPRATSRVIVSNTDSSACAASLAVPLVTRGERVDEL